MPLIGATELAVIASAIVAVLSAVMAYLGLRSYRKTRNPRLVFVSVAFIAFVLKSIFVGYNVTYHIVPHDSIEFVSALFDVLIVLMLFIPFFLDTGR